MSEAPPTTQTDHFSWRTYLGLLGSPLLVVAFVALIGIATVSLLGAVRAYGAGESMWAKSRAQAVHHLLRYAHDRDERHYQLFVDALYVPHSDRMAREGMETGQLSHENVRQLLISGRNHPDDVDNMIRLFHWFGQRWVLQDVRKTWADGDRLIAQLGQEAAQLKQAIQANKPQEELAPQIARIDELNEQLNAAGIAFHDALGYAARITERILIGGIVGTAILLSLISVMQVRQVLIKQERHQDLLQRANRRWQLASEAGGFGLYEMERDTGTIHLDATSAAMHGLPAIPTSLPREAIRALIVPDDAPQTRRDTDAALSNGEVFKITYRVRQPGGQIRTLEATGGLVQAQHGISARLMGVLKDITDELAQADLAMKRDAAERIASAQREFLSRLSHELRTPLNAILGFAQLMQLERQGNSPQTQQQAKMIMGAGQQLLALVEDVLDLSKVESGHIAMALQTVDVVALTRDCLPLLDTPLQKHQLRLIDQLGDQAVWGMADAQRLKQVMVNLLTNACKYNRLGGTVTVSLQDPTQTPGWVCIDVTDTGQGLSPQDQAELFQPFKRLDPSARVEGTGLGLYIVKQLVERMHGEVRLHSTVGLGSTFTVAIPVAPPANAS